MSGPIESKPPVWMRVLVAVLVEPWGAVLMFVLMSVVLIAAAASFGALTAGFLVTIAVAFAVGVGTLALVRWKQRESFAALREKRRSGELYEQLRRKQA